MDNILHMMWPKRRSRSTLYRGRFLIATDALQLLLSVNVNEFRFTEAYPNFGIIK